MLAYCSRNPNCDDIDLIVEQCHAFLNNKIASFGGAAVRASPNPSSNGNDHSLEEDIDALVQMLPNHGEKAFLRFLNQKPELERSRYLKRVLYRAVKEFCETYPDVKNVHSVLKYVRNTLHDDNQLIDLLDPLEVDLTESSQSNNDCIVIDDAYDLTTNSSSSSSSNSGAISGRTISRGVTLTPRDRILRICKIMLRILSYLLLISPLAVNMAISSGRHRQQDRHPLAAAGRGARIDGDERAGIYVCMYICM